MKKITVLITSLIITLLLISCSSGDNNIANKSERELRIGLNEAKVYSSFYDNDGNPGNKVLTEFHTFDKDGNIATSTLYYDENEDEGETWKSVYKYNQVNMPIKIITYMNGEEINSTTIKYYPGDTIKAGEIGEGFAEGAVEKHEIKYDDKGNEIYFAFYRDGILQREGITENVYNDKNQLVKTIRNGTYYYEGMEGPEAEAPEIIEFAFNSDDQLIEKKEIGGDKVIKYKYNKRGLLEEELSSKGEVIKYKYDKKGLLEEKVIYNEDGKTSSIEITEYK